ncbi:MAG: c-type cytochrome [Chitinophagaceae bacterium]|nr:c-type cytochrome [Chitinophagaceae bacterium]
MGKSIFIALLLLVGATILFFKSTNYLSGDKKVVEAPVEKRSMWKAPDYELIPDTKQGDLIRYGRELISFTSKYLGPHGTIAHISNGMNCQNCHLEAGTREWGNNYSAVFSSYPKFRARSGSVETINKRVNDCLQRSLNGEALDSGSREMQAIILYIQWLGKKIPHGIKPYGAGITDLPFMNRAADSSRGKLVFALKCSNCHGSNGQGILNSYGNMYLYPPLWGANSYNDGAGLYRLSRLAGYVKNNMPFNRAINEPKITDEEAWDVAAYINSRPRPLKNYRSDWPDIKLKPFDHPYGPYADAFTETQHKFGPFVNIVNKQVPAH